MRTPRPAFAILEVVLAFLAFAIALAGIYPLLVMQARQVKKAEAAFQSQAPHYLVPSGTAWARKLGAAAKIQTTDPEPLPASPVLLIDQADAAYSDLVTGWTTEAKSGAYLGSHRRQNAGLGLNTATWKFTGLPAGYYDVRATWLEHPNQATDAQFKVYDALTLRGTFTVNQQAAPAGSTSNGQVWQSLGTVSIHDDPTLTGGILETLQPGMRGTIQVILSDLANGHVIADAVWLVPVRNEVSVTGLAKSLTSEEVTAQVTVTQKVP